MNTSRRSFLKLSATAASLAAVAKPATAAAPSASVPGKKFFKGQFHTHTFWSDGQAFPEQSVRFYKSRGYDFLGLSDHNVYANTRRVRAIDSINKDIFNAYVKEFPDMVEKAPAAKGKPGVVLSTMDKIRKRFEEPGKFVLIDAVEASHGVSRNGVGNQVHMNYLNVPGEPPYLRKLNPADTPVERIRNMDKAVNELAALAKRDPMFIVNHPVWQWYDITPEDIIALPQVRFFELCNGGATWDHADGLPDDGLATDRFWDAVNAFRARRGQPLLYGVGNDDTHQYFGTVGSKPGDHCLPFNAWSYVRAEALTADALIRAMKAGDFACCEGFSPEDFAFDKATGTLSISVAGAPDVARTIEFVVTKKDFSETPVKTLKDVRPANAPKWAQHVKRTINVYDPKKVGVVVKKVSGGLGEAVKASYTMAADDLYVRARVISPVRPAVSLHAYQHPKTQMCWTQPYQK